MQPPAPPTCLHLQRCEPVGQGILVVWRVLRAGQSTDTGQIVVPEGATPTEWARSLNGLIGKVRQHALGTPPAQEALPAPAVAPPARPEPTRSARLAELARCGGAPPLVSGAAAASVERRVASAERPVASAERPVASAERPVAQPKAPPPFPPADLAPADRTAPAEAQPATETQWQYALALSLWLHEELGVLETLPPDGATYVEVATWLARVEAETTRAAAG